jgi:ABC-type uncharacterized transport system ATPase subunit
MSSGTLRGLMNVMTQSMNGRAPAAVEARGLVKTYDDVEAVRGVDLRVESGEVFGFLGPNGAGKSTTVKMLTPTPYGATSASRCRRPGSTRARTGASC